MENFSIGNKVEKIVEFDPLTGSKTNDLNLIKLLTVEQQENSKIFILINEFFSILDNKNWIKDYIFKYVMSNINNNR